MIYDIAILGGGAAGLSLARHMVDTKHKIAIIEPRRSYRNDRTWCFFNSQSHDLSDLVCAYWSEYSLESLGQEIVFQNEKQLYQCIRSIDFYQDAYKKINTSHNIDLVLGETALDICHKDNNFDILMNNNKLQATYVIDTRPAPKSDYKSPYLNQIFSGIEVQTHTPLFNPGRALLMHNLTCDKHGLGFVYILPFSANHALIEWTRFTPDQLTPDQLDQECAEICLSFAGDRYEALYKEHASIPMAHIKPQKQHPHIFLAGGRGGAIRPSTGYAFQNIQKWAKKCAQSIKQTGLPIDHIKQNAFSAWMDKIFLRVLLDYPELGPGIKMRLAKGLNDDQFTRFMKDEATISDNLAIILSQPFWPFLKTAFRDMLNIKINQSQDY